MSFKFIVFHFILKYKIWLTTFVIGFILFIMQLFKENGLDLIHEKIDVVYTWVNGSDERFLENLNLFLKINKSNYIDSSVPRFDDKSELKFSLRSLERNAPWINHVYIVTNGQIPYWLNLDYEKVSVISHEQIFDNLEDLPTFSSPAIESYLHNIPGITKRFIYFNDDIFLGEPIYLDDFYTSSRGNLIYLSWPISECASDCPWLYVNDGQCDSQCYTKDCQYDGADCADEPKDAQGALVKPYLIDEADFPINSSQNTPKPINVTSFLQAITPNNNITTYIKAHNLKIIRKNKIKRRTLIKQRKQKLGYVIADLDAPLITNVNTFANSLQFTNRLFNTRFVFKQRYVMAHMPFLIDTQLMRELKQTFHKEFATTSRNKIRRNNDVQFAFSYFYYLIHERQLRNISQIFALFDSDQSGTWSDREIRTILTKLYDLPLTYEIVDQFESILINCSINKRFINVQPPEFERYIDSKLPTISVDLIAQCPQLTGILLKKFGGFAKHKFELIKNAEEQVVTFKMLTSNVSELVGHLDEIRRKTTKFICLNDNLDTLKTEENDLVKAVLYDFYLSLFPNPSKFELPQEFRNRFSYLDDLNDWRSFHLRLKLILFIIFLISLYICTFYFNKRVICGHVNKNFP